MSATAYLKQIVTRKDEIEAFAGNVINEVKNGEQNPLEVMVMIKALERSLELIKEGIADNVLNEAEKYGKSFDFKGAKVTIKETGVRYDFSKCNYPKWKYADQQEKDGRAIKKEAEEYLKAVKEPFECVDTDTGETYRINPPIKSSTTGVSISF